MVNLLPQTLPLVEVHALEVDQLMIVFRLFSSFYFVCGSSISLLALKKPFCLFLLKFLVSLEWKFVPNLLNLLSFRSSIDLSSIEVLS